MPLRKQTAQAAERARHFATGSARQLQARAKYLAHLAAAQGYRAAASAEEATTRATALARRHPLSLLALAAGCAALLGFGLLSRRR
ncbi:MAG: DUF883 domain-containing protein [Xanthomonadaceae bacterium]|nr:DUF883 domain-containing protein [Xanthomonadaceae bacterium]